MYMCRLVANVAITWQVRVQCCETIKLTAFAFAAQQNIVDPDGQNIVDPDGQDECPTCGAAGPCSRTLFIDNSQKTQSFLDVLCVVEN